MRASAVAPIACAGSVITASGSTVRSPSRATRPAAERLAGRDLARGDVVGGLHGDFRLRVDGHGRSPAQRTPTVVRPTGAPVGMNGSSVVHAAVSARKRGRDRRGGLAGQARDPAAAGTREPCGGSTPGSCWPGGVAGWAAVAALAAGAGFAETGTARGAGAADAARAAGARSCRCGPAVRDSMRVRPCRRRPSRSRSIDGARRAISGSGIHAGGCVDRARRRGWHRSRRRYGRHDHRASRLRGVAGAGRAGGGTCTRAARGTTRVRRHTRTRRRIPPNCPPLAALACASAVSAVSRPGITIIASSMRGRAAIHSAAASANTPAVREPPVPSAKCAASHRRIPDPLLRFAF